MQKYIVPLHTHVHTCGTNLFVIGVLRVFFVFKKKKKEKNFPFLLPSPQWHLHCYSGADSELLHANINSCSAGVLLALNALSCQVKLTLNAI